MPSPYLPPPSPITEDSHEGQEPEAGAGETHVGSGTGKRGEFPQGALQLGFLGSWSRGPYSLPGLSESLSLNFLLLSNDDLLSDVR